MTFRRINTGLTEQTTHLELLDVEHVIDSSHCGGFFTIDYIKHTATDRTFLHGKSHHPPSVFKFIVFGEAVRLRRLNESYTYYVERLTRLRTKCFKSNFNMGMVDDKLTKAKNWTDRFGPKSSKEHKDNILVWPLAFKNILKYTNKEKLLVPEQQLSTRNKHH